VDSLNLQSITLSRWYRKWKFWKSKVKKMIT